MFLNIPLVITVLLHSITSFLGLNYIHITRQYEIHGIDVSHHQRFIDWEKVAEHSQFKVSFTFLKATEGTTIRDTRFETNWKESKEAGLVRLKIISERLTLQEAIWLRFLILKSTTIANLRH